MFKDRKINYLFLESLHILHSRVTSFGIVARLGPGQLGVRIRADERDFPVLQKKLGRLCGPLSPLSTAYRVFSLRVKWPGHEADHSIPPASKFNNSVKLLLHVFM